jgi:hypothetical protein
LLKIIRASTHRTIEPSNHPPSHPSTYTDTHHPDRHQTHTPQAVHENTDSLKLLLNVNATYYKDKDGKTVSHIAAESNSVASLKYIFSIRAGMLL